MKISWKKIKPIILLGMPYLWRFIKYMLKRKTKIKDSDLQKIEDTYSEVTNGSTTRESKTSKAASRD